MGAGMHELGKADGTASSAQRTVTRPDGFLKRLAANKDGVAVAIAITSLAAGGVGYGVGLVKDLWRAHNIAMATISETQEHARSMVRLACQLVAEVQVQRANPDPTAIVPAFTELRTSITDVGNRVDEFAAGVGGELIGSMDDSHREARALIHALQNAKYQTVAATAYPLAAFKAPPLEQKVFENLLKAGSIKSGRAVRVTALVAGDTRKVPCDNGPNFKRIELALAEADADSSLANLNNPALDISDRIKEAISLEDLAWMDLVQRRVADVADPTLAEEDFQLQLFDRSNWVAVDDEALEERMEQIRAHSG
jgi:hypothetical protein